LQWLQKDWHQQSVWLSGALVGQLLEGPRETASELRWTPFLESNLFAGGLSASHPHMPALNSAVSSIVTRTKAVVPQSKSSGESDADRTFLQGVQSGKPADSAAGSLLAHMEKVAGYRAMVLPTLRDRANEVLPTSATVPIGRPCVTDLFARSFCACS
jgi:hypothetical protein